jgi:hypothetical protein
MFGRDARKLTARGRKSATAPLAKARRRHSAGTLCEGKRKRIEGRSRMSKRQLQNVLGVREVKAAHRDCFLSLPQSH